MTWQSQSYSPPVKYLDPHREGKTGLKFTKIAVPNYIVIGQTMYEKSVTKMHRVNKSYRETDKKTVNDVSVYHAVTIMQEI